MGAERSLGHAQVIADVKEIVLDLPLAELIGRDHVVGCQLGTARKYSRRLPSTSPASCMSRIMRLLSSDIVIPFREWGPKNSSHNGRKSQGITPESLDGQPPPSLHNPPSSLPPSRGEAASSN